MTFAGGERGFTEWMAENAFVSWWACERPWELEHHLIGALDVPLNLQRNRHNRFHAQLTRARADASHVARSLPVVPSPGAGAT
jgi:hypothetical protein